MPGLTTWCLLFGLDSSGSSLIAGDLLLLNPLLTFLSMLQQINHFPLALTNIGSGSAYGTSTFSGLNLIWPL